MQVLEAQSNYYGKPGADTAYEFSEAYEGAKLSQVSGISSGNSNTTGTTYEMAHTSPNTIPQSGGQYYEYRDKNGNNSGDVRYSNGTATYFVQEGKRPPLILQTAP